jgi:hypothetical protein
MSLTDKENLIEKQSAYYCAQDILRELTAKGTAKKTLDWLTKEVFRRQRRMNDASRQKRENIALSQQLKNQLVENTVKLCRENGFEIEVCKTRKHHCVREDYQTAEKLLVKIAVAIRHDANMKNYFDEINEFLKGE